MHVGACAELHAEALKLKVHFLQVAGFRAYFEYMRVELGEMARLGLTQLTLHLLCKLINMHIGRGNASCSALLSLEA